MAGHIRILISPVDKIIFHSKRMDTGCWEWMRHKNSCGYGASSIDGVQMPAHRVSYIAFKGTIPAGFHIDHKCKNRGCVNPMHLEAVTPRENNARSESPYSINAKKLSCVRGHPLSGENIYQYRGRRKCRQCNYQRNKQWREGRRNEISA